MKKQTNVIKIGRYYYRRLRKDENGEPILRKNEEFCSEELFYLADTRDGEPIETFRRLK